MTREARPRFNESARVRWVAPLFLVLLAGCGGGAKAEPEPLPVRLLEFSGQPTGSTAGSTFSVLVRITDGDGVVVPVEGALVTVSAWGSLPELQGPKIAATARGVASFTGLRIDQAGQAWQIQAESTGMAAVQSTPFDVLPGPVAALDVQLGQATAMPSRPVPIRVTAIDAFANPTGAYGGTVALTCTDPAAVLPPPHAFQPVEAGRHDFPLTFSAVGAFTVTATDTAVGAIRGTTDVSVLDLLGMLTINEVVYDDGADGAAVFVELRGAPSTLLAGLELVSVGADLVETPAVELTGLVRATGFFVVATSGANAVLLAVSDLFDDGVDMPEPDGGVALYFDRGGPDERLVDMLFWGDAPAPHAEWPAASRVSPGSSLGRTPDGEDTDDNASDFEAYSEPTPGGPNAGPSGS